MMYYVKRASDSKNELYHWEIKKKHKYVAKVKNKKGKYRYFYDNESYSRYLKNKTKSTGNSLRNRIKTGLNAVSTKLNTSIESLNTKKSKKSSISKVKGITLFYTREQVENVVYRAIKKLSNLQEKKKEHKYIEKVKLPNGKYRYFYDQDEYNAYLKRLEYQRDEPDFMKNISDISKNDVKNAEEDMGEINENYNPRILDYSMNCMNCTTAYELRRRGYDVEAKANPDGYSIAEMDNWYENPEYYYLTSSSATKVDVNSSAVYPQRYSAYDIEKQISDTYPPNSRGNIMVQWKSGGAHSMAYEVDSSGDVTIRDCQTNQEVNMVRLSKSINMAFTVRTDNLELKEGVLDVVKEN